MQFLKIPLCKIIFVLSLILTLGRGKKSDDASISHPCCPGSITLGATGAAAAKWAQYLGQYKPTKQKHEGAPVYQNQNGKYLYHHTKGQWRTNNVVNKRGVFKGEGSKKAACVSTKSKWYFWDEEWRRGDIKVSCDQDTVMIEPHGKKIITSTSTLEPQGRLRKYSFNISNPALCLFQGLITSYNEVNLQK